MAYGLHSTSLALSRGPSPVHAIRPAIAAKAWRQLPADRRLAMIEESLARIGIRDGYPLAL